jgi:eukaryotic-like serine/threonine-protein kinase
MDPERWQQINELFQDAVELGADRRTAFLDEACAGDNVLRGEIESLLASDACGWELIEKPALEVAAPMLADEQPQFVPGQQIGHYEIISLIGKGGMGEVYLAKDQRLGRRVALKLLPVDYTRDKDRLRRFQQEAQAASALNHPNILTIHELTQVDSKQLIATEFVDGETLRQRMKRAQLSPRETLDVAIQIAGALDAAHQAGIVHRDIKPENIMLRPDGYVKVLDFGLAKLTEQPSLIDVEGSTLRRIDTTAGLVLGTAKYMSPEQARGLNVDARSDIFSLGIVLYEMITSHAPFEGETASDLIAAILKEDALPLTHYLPNAPDELQRIIDKALRKDKRERYQTVRDFVVDLRRLKDELGLESKLEDSVQPARSGQASTVSSAQAAVPTADELTVLTRAAGVIHRASSAEYIVSEIRRHKIGTALTLAILFISTAGVGYLINKFVTQPESTASSENIKLTRISTSGKAANAAISPDGRYVAYVTFEVGQQSLWIRQVPTNSNVQILPPSTTTYWGLTFSPDGNYLYYYGSAKDDPEPSLYQMPALGGVSRKLITGMVNSNGDSPITFSPDGRWIAFVREYSSGESAVAVASADGTEEQKLAMRKDPAFFASAAWSPDGKRIACVSGSRDSKGFYAEVIEIGLDGGPETPITDRRWRWISDVAWLSDGGGLLITASDQEGSSIQIWQLLYRSGKARRITTDLNNYSGLSLTANSSALVTTQNNKVMHIWTQPDGDAESAKQITSGAATKDGWDGISWTPDGRIIYSSHASGSPDLWIMEPDGSKQKQLTVDLGSDTFGLSVSPNGRYIVFVSDRAGKANIWRVNIDGSNAKQLTNGSGEFNPFCSPDSNWVFYLSGGTQWKVPIDGGEPAQLIDPYSNMVGISPDGKLIAYFTSSDQTKEKKVGIVSSEGGEPISVLDLPPTPIPRRMQWTPDGRALTYISNRGGASNIWNQPIDGSQPKQLTDFKTHFIHGFAWSRDGKQLACARWTTTSDVILIKNFR